MTLLLLLRLAFAHGGVDDEAPAAATAVPVGGDTISRAAASHAFDAVVRFSRTPQNTAAPAVLFLADAATSAPVSDATAALALTGPASVEADFAPTPRTGVYSAPTTFPKFGDYSGALTISANATSDLLAVSTFNMDLPPSASPDSPAWALAGLVGALVVAAAAGLVGAGAGFALGRRRGTAAGLLALGLGGALAQRVEAHGGVDDEGPPTKVTAAAPGGSLALSMESQFLLGLRTERLGKGSFQDRVEALGRFVSRPGESAALRAAVSGTVLAPPGGFPTPGREVHAGDILATIEETPGSADRASVAQERAAAATELAEARKALALAERDVAQIPTLADSLAPRERLDREQGLTVAQARVSAAEAALSALGNGVRIAIRAPVSGRLGATTARPGDQVEAGDPLFRVTDPAGLWVEARLPERAALGVAGGAPALVLASADPGHALQAVVLDAGQEADPATGTVLVTLAVEDDSGGLRAGMGASVWIGRGPPRDALTVPDAAVVDSNGATLAFVKTGPESFEMREVKLGGRSGETWEVLDGLAPRERVVTTGTYTLRSLAGR